LGSRKDPRVGSATAAGNASRGVGSVGIKHALSDERHAGGIDHRVVANRRDEEPSEAGTESKYATMQIKRSLKASEDGSNNAGLQQAIKMHSQQEIRNEGQAGSGKDDYAYEGSRQLGSTTFNASVINPSNASALYLE